MQSKPPAPGEAEKIMQSYPCAFCKAPVGQPCTTSRGTRASHAPRFWNAVKDERFPLTDATPNDPHGQYR